MLRDALAAGARTALAHEDELHGPECSCVVLADVILADPAFRQALTESIAEAHSTIEDAFDMTDAEVAAAIVARMLL
jgi:hypothetical protein